jgi:hypothetical protein
LFLEGINKSLPSGSWLKNYRLILDMFITVSLPPISDMGKGLKEREGDLFTVGKIMDKLRTMVSTATGGRMRKCAIWLVLHFLYLIFKWNFCRYVGHF